MTVEEAVALSKVKHAKCATLFGNKAYEVAVESTLVRALPGFNIVGLTDISIQESRERVKSALSSIDFQFPSQKITINLSPLILKKREATLIWSRLCLSPFKKNALHVTIFLFLGNLVWMESSKQRLRFFPL